MEQAVLKLSDKQSEVWNLLNEPGPIEEVFYGGAAGGGKSLLICAWQTYRRILYPGTVGLIGRESFRSLKDTTFQTFVRFWDDFGRFNPLGVTMTIVGSPANAIFSNGSRILFRHVSAASNEEGHEFGSLELTDLAIDEVAECPQEKVELLMSRIRHRLISGKPAALLCGNPSDNWVMTKYIMDEFDEPVVLADYARVVHANLEDNPDPDFVRIYKGTLDKLNPYDRDRLLFGIWGGKKDNKAPYFYAFNRSMVRIADPVKNFEMWQAWDFNFDPASTLFGQLVQGKGMFIHEEVQANGGTAELCTTISGHPYIDRRKWIIMVTGDSSGSKATSAAGKDPSGRHVSDFRIIMSSQRLTQGQFRVFSKNHELPYSAKVVNYAMREIPLFINPKCKRLIRDLETAVRKPDGGLVKDRKAHKQDLGDAFRYMIHAWFPRGIPDIEKFARSLKKS